MFLRKYKPTSPARRSEKRINVAPLGAIFKPKLIPARIVRGFGRKKQNHKPLYTPSTKYYNTARDYIYQDTETYCTFLFRPTYSNCFIACITTGSGASYYMKSYHGQGLGIPIAFHQHHFLKEVYYHLGSLITLMHTQTGAMCFSLIIKASQGWKIAESAGTFCKIL